MTDLAVVRDVLAVLEASRQALDEAERRLRASLPTDADPPAVSLPPRQLSPKQAAAFASVTPSTIRRWLTAYPHLGRKVAGRWRIEEFALRRALDDGLVAREMRVSAPPARGCHVA